MNASSCGETNKNAKMSYRLTIR